MILQKKIENYKDQFKDIDTEEKAYFLGLIYGDGHCTADKSYKFLLASIKDDLPLFKDILKNFKFLKLSYYERKPNVYFLENCEKSFCLDLKNLGFYGNKVKRDLDKNFYLPKIKENLFHHFIRGFFDADGSVYIPTRKRSRNNVRTEITLATKKFLLEMYEILKKTGINFKYIERAKKCSNQKYYKSYSLITTSRKESLKFYDYIYKNATIFSKRKKLKFETVDYPLEEKLSNNPLSPCCNSISTSNGKRQNKNTISFRYKCKKCNKQFSIKEPVNLVIN